MVVLSEQPACKYLRQCGGSVTDTGKAEWSDRLSVESTSTDGIHVLTVAGEIDH
ncbi:hypothetical protein SY2F82_17960 [Streptomyces sp. Y2F8-2]|nr:hypothetical protein SY2F82_17960 [Streptomyces sp. Y2F8-2]